MPINILALCECPMNKEYLKNVITDQRDEISERLAEEDIIPREGFDVCRSYISHPNLLLVSGLRRAGKSFFSHLLTGKKKYAFLNFDDERLVEFKVADFNLVLECFYELYKDFEYIIFDEIQNIKGWELFISRLRSKYKIIITGSNANLLSKDLATHLTGRFLDFVIFPLSFKEFLTFNNFTLHNKALYSTRGRSEIAAFFEKYLKTGGIFDYYKFGSAFLRNLWSSIIVKDIVVRHGIKYPHILEQLSLVIINNFACKISGRNLTRQFELRSPHTINEYIRHLEETFLIFTINKFSYKIKEQMTTLKKIYVIDNGFINALSFKFSENKGRLLENIVAVELKRRIDREQLEIFYWDNYNVECDFIVKKMKKVVMAYQVCTEIAVNNKEREIAGLTGAMKEFGLKKGIILTISQEEEMNINGFKIVLVPVWKWLLSESVTITN